MTALLFFAIFWKGAFMLNTIFSLIEYLLSYNPITKALRTPEDTHPFREGVIDACLIQIQGL